jgi:hypothetical protein
VKHALAVVLLLLGTTSMLVGPAAAKKQRGPSCPHIREALAGGKSAEDVAKDMKVSAATVQRCSANKGKPAAHRSAKNSAMKTK